MMKVDRWAMTLWSLGALVAAGGVWASCAALHRSQLLVLAFLILAAGLPWGVRWRQERLWQRAVASRGWVWFWGGLGGVALVLSLWPPARLRSPWIARQRLLVWAWIWLAWGAGWMLWQSPTGQRWWREVKASWNDLKRRYGWSWLGVTLLLWGGAVGIAWTRWGLTSPWPLNWQGLAVPLLAQQVLVALGMGGLAAEAWRRWGHQRPKIWFWGGGLLLWLLAWGVWWHIEPTPNYFLPQAYPPNQERYPLSDALTYDLDAWQARLGYGYRAYADKHLNRGNPFDNKIGLIGTAAEVQNLVVWWHGRFSATDFWFWFVGILSWTVPLAYLLGKRMYSASFGVGLAGGLLLRENGALLAARHLDAVHVKNLMSEPLLREVLLLLVTALVATLSERRFKRALVWAALTGMALGWAVLTRTESLLLLPVLFLPGLHVVKKRQRWRQSLGLILVALVGLFGVWAPWMWRTALITQDWAPQYGGQTIWFFWGKASQGLSPDYRLPATPTPTPAPSSEVEPQRLRETSGSEVQSRGGGRMAFPWPPRPALEGSQPLSEVVRFLQRLPLIGALFRWPKETWLQWWHYIGRNVVMSWTTLPWTLRFYDPLQITYLRPLADGRPLGWGGALALAFNLAIVALGMVAVWQRHRPAAWAPWVVYGLYLTGVAFGRTGGGRYVIPVDWIPLLYYLLGWFVLLQVVWRHLHSETDVLQRRPASPVGLWGLVFVLFAASVGGVVLERRAIAVVDARIQHEPLPPRRRVVTPQDVLDRLEAWGAFEHPGMPSRAWLEQHWQEQHWVPRWGYAFYPRYLSAGEKCGDLCKHQVLQQDTLFFVLLDSRRYAQLAFFAPPDVEPWLLGAEAVVIHCPQRIFSSTHYRALLIAFRPQDDVNLRLYFAPPAQWRCAP